VDDIASSRPTGVDDPAEAMGHVRDVAEAMDLAASAIERIQQHILRIAALARSAGDLPTTVATAPLAWQAEVAREVRSIERIVDSTESGGCKLLDGTWSVTLAEASGGGAGTLRIAEMSSRVLGNAGIGGYLASLTTLDDCGVGVAVRVQDVSRCALLQAAAARKEILSFLQDVVEPLASAIEITIANRTAADLAVGDLAFAGLASQLTPLDALAQARLGGFEDASSRTFSINSQEDAAARSEPPSDNNSRQ